MTVPRDIPYRLPGREALHTFIEQAKLGPIRASILAYFRKKRTEGCKVLRWTAHVDRERLVLWVITDGLPLRCIGREEQIVTWMMPFRPPGKYPENARG